MFGFSKFIIVCLMGCFECVFVTLIRVLALIVLGLDWLLLLCLLYIRFKLVFMDCLDFVGCICLLEGLVYFGI